MLVNLSKVTSILLLISFSALAQKQYTEGACLLLQQQAERFAGQPQSENYQSALRELNRGCINPIPAPVKDLVLTNIPAKPVKLEGKTIVVPTAKPAVTAGKMPVTTAQNNSPAPTPVKPAAKFDLESMGSVSLI